MTILPGPLEASCGCDNVVLDRDLFSLDAALARIAAGVGHVEGCETLPLRNARGRVLAEPVRARADMPRFDHAAMDGYAVRATTLTGPGPWSFPVTGRIAAGDDGSPHLPAGAAVRILTGAPIPPGTTAVVMQEAVSRLGDAIEVQDRPRPFENIRRRGEEHAEGDSILPRGTRLTARAVAACAAAGCGAVTVRRVIRVTLLVSGQELVEVGCAARGVAQIWDVNTPMLAAALDRPDVAIVEIAALPDNPNLIRDFIERAAEHSDLILTTGGVSVGEEDHLHTAIKAAGGSVSFAGVAIKPGKPVAFGQVGSALWLGLPGNPQSAFVTWTLFGELVLQKLSGLAFTHRVKRHAVLSEALRHKIGRCEIRAASVIGFDSHGREVVDCSAPVRSGQVSALFAADGLVFLPSDTEAMPAAALVEFLPFRSELR